MSAIRAIMIIFTDFCKSGKVSEFRLYPINELYTLHKNFTAPETLPLLQPLIRTYLLGSIQHMFIKGMSKVEVALGQKCKNIFYIHTNTNT